MPHRQRVLATLVAAPVALGGAGDRNAARGQSVSTRLLFLIVGIANATWAPLVPLVQDRAGLRQAQAPGTPLQQPDPEPGLQFRHPT